MSDGGGTIIPMAVRSDLALQLQLEFVSDSTNREDVRTAIRAALAHMASGRGRSRKGGRSLLHLLETVRSTAAAGNDWHAVRLLQDSLDYAEGRLLRPDFEDRYRLFQPEPGRPNAHQNFLAKTLSANLQYFSQAGSQFLTENPTASTRDVLAHVEALGKDAAFMQPSTERPGRFQILRGRAEIAAWLEHVLRERVDVEDPEETARRIVMSPESLAVLAADEEGQLLLKAAELQRRHKELRVLRDIAENPRASESDLQHALQGQPWIFGGQFIGEVAKRRLVPGDEVDLPLIRGDGSLHIVELKRSMSLRSPLVKWSRGFWVPTAEVHDAVSQAVNYLIGLDEHRHRIREELGLETRRASATVLVGHPAIQSNVPEEKITEALRTLNGHVTRIEVMTYKELIDNAERALGWSEKPRPQGGDTAASAVPRSRYAGY